MQTKHIITFTLIACGGTSVATAQTGQYEPASSRLFYQVFDTASNTWSTNTSVAPGSRVEWRAVLSYTGTNTDVSALGSLRYQPTLSNVDNNLTAGTQDEFRPWRIPNSLTGQSALLTPEEGETGLPLFSYGRVTFGPTFGTNNELALFRHTNGNANAPAGSWVRIATTLGSFWPLSQLSGAQATNASLNAIARGVWATQNSATSPISGEPNLLHVAGTQNLVIFRCAILLSDLQDARVLTLATAPGSMDRIGGVNDPDDRRYMTWQTSPTDNGSWRSGVVLEGATINVIPGPGSITAIALGVACVVRRRRS